MLSNVAADGKLRASPTSPRSLGAPKGSTGAVSAKVSSNNEDQAEEEGEQLAFNEQIFDCLAGHFEKALCDGTTPFAGDLENEQYKAILSLFKTYQPPSE